jgi:hypothetical protein
LRRGLFALTAAALLLAAVAAVAEVRRLEVVGAVPTDPGSDEQALRRAALEAALDEAVSRVARGLLAGAEGESPELDLAEVLGVSTDYALRYRVLEERGERRALLVDDPGVTMEFVVLVEVHVDVDRVAARLEDAGLAATLGTGRSFDLELLEVPSERAFAAVRRALVEQVGAERVVPVELEAGRAVLRVETTQGSKAAVSRLLAAELGPGLSVQSMSSAGGVVRMRVFEMAPEESPAEPTGPPGAASGDPSGGDGTSSTDPLAR